eukprot:4652369-Amphidinium_carterae.1
MYVNWKPLWDRKLSATRCCFGMQFADRRHQLQIATKSLAIIATCVAMNGATSLFITSHGLLPMCLKRRMRMCTLAYLDNERATGWA